MEMSARPGKLLRLGTGIAGTAAAALLVALVAALTPWPSALLIRGVFEAGARAIVDEMEPHAPVGGLVEDINVPAGDSGASVLDRFSPEGTSGALPTIVWVHGGAWLSGSAADVRPYLRILASHGYTTIGLNYPVAPESAYPAALTELNDVLGWILSHADELNVDPSQIVLAGDSAGAQLASQLAALTTNPGYARLLGIEPALSPDALAATILHCGVYDLRAMAELTGITAWGFKIALWGYTGTRDWSDTAAGATMSTISFATEEFPPTFISGGNGDRLTWLQSVPMAATLRQAGVEVTELFWPAEHEPALPHEYQFHLNLDEAQTALSDTLAFLERQTH